MDEEKVFQINTITQIRNDYYRTKLQINIPELVNINHSNFLSLYEYLKITPKKFYSKDAFTTYYYHLKLIENHSKQDLKFYFDDRFFEIDNALLTLDEINKYDWHDSKFDHSDLEQTRFIDKTIHPTYLKLIEAVYTPLLRIFEYFNRKSKNKDTNKINVFNIVENLPAIGFGDFAFVYSHVVRNSIAHGCTKYLNYDIIYTDNNTTIQKHMSYIVNLVDDLLDICNGFVFALSLFLLVSINDKYRLPYQLLLKELVAETSSESCKIDGFIEMGITKNSQLNIFVECKTKHHSKIMFFIINSSYILSKIYIEFDEYFFKMTINGKILGTARVKSREFRELTFENYTGLDKIVKNIDLVPFINLRNNKPMLSLLSSIADVLKTNFPIYIEHIFPRRKVINVRRTSIHRNGLGAVCKVDIVLSKLGESISKQYILDMRRMIIRLAIRRCRRKTNNIILKMLPITFIEIHLFQKDYRLRKLNSFGLGEDLIGTIRIQRNSYMQVPFIWHSTIERYGQIIFAWNRAWLKNNNS